MLKLGHITLIWAHKFRLLKRLNKHGLDILCKAPFTFKEGSHMM
jgi:hypothetical protein